MRKKTPQEVSALGHAARWHSRPDIIEKLRRYFDKQRLDELLSWPTEHLEFLLSYIETK